MHKTTVRRLCVSICLISSVSLFLLALAGCGPKAIYPANPPQGAKWGTFHQRFLKVRTVAVSSSSSSGGTTTTTTQTSQNANQQYVDAPFNSPLEPAVLSAGETVTEDVLKGINPTSSNISSGSTLAGLAAPGVK
ncbi:MAG TPA: hypothetical protein PKH54_00255 [Myxococcota bacterium]|nr:hypothetical protein [Myxococcota bacterium]HOC98345.1 hypothetical protein [Myxococcota bacterium]HOH77367.1 hypothetical protein [Myxococcota bacterium]